MEPRIPELALDQQLCFALYDTSRALTRAYGPLLADLGLTYPQYLVMLALWEATGPQTVGELGAALHLDSGTLTPLLKRLAQQGLVERTRDAGDERRVLVTPTLAGRELRARAAGVPARIAQLCGIDADTVHALRDGLARINGALEEAG